MRRESGQTGRNDAPPEPWRSFLRELDDRLTGGVELHCIGGFVVSLSLTRANGTVMRALPTRQRVDFAELVDLAEFVTAATIPNA
jgi:hypothetical protein